jgi:hypothetical protein
VPGRGVVVLAAAVGLAAGVGGAALLWPGGRGAGLPAETSAGQSTTTTSAPVWVSRKETRLGPAVVVAGGLEIEDGRVLFTYDLEPITPQQGTLTLDGAGLPPAAPASFTMAYTGGTSSARVLGPSQRATRFDVPPGFTLDEIQEIRVDSYWVAAPARFPVALSSSSGAWVPMAPGVRARILQVVEQTSNRLVVVELEGDATLAADLSIAGEGREWRSSSSSQLGTPRWTLDYRGGALPDPVQLLARGVAWVEVTGGGPLNLEGIPR